MMYPEYVSFLLLKSITLDLKILPTEAILPPIRMGNIRISLRLCASAFQPGKHIGRIASPENNHPSPIFFLDPRKKTILERGL